MTEMPPQAYTRETLMVAYEWFQRQSASIQELASTPDALVSLYLQYKRKKPTTFEQEAPVSAQIFKEDLKRLSVGLDAFTDTTVPEYKRISSRQQQSTTVPPIERQTSAASIARGSRTAPSYHGFNKNQASFSAPSAGRAGVMSQNNYYGNAAQQMNYQGPSSGAPHHGPSTGQPSMGSSYNPENYSNSPYVPAGSGGSAAIAYESAPMDRSYHNPLPPRSAQGSQREPLTPPIPPRSETTQAYGSGNDGQAYRPSSMEKVYQARYENRAQVPGPNHSATPAPSRQWSQPSSSFERPAPQNYSAPAANPRENADMSSEFRGLLDQKTQEMIRQVTEGLNLGSEREALRLLVSLGYKRLRPIMEEMAGGDC